MNLKGGFKPYHWDPLGESPRRIVEFVPLLSILGFNSFESLINALLSQKFQDKQVRSN